MNEFPQKQKHWGECNTTFWKLGRDIVQSVTAVLQGSDKSCIMAIDIAYQDEEVKDGIQTPDPFKVVSIAIAGDPKVYETFKGKLEVVKEKEWKELPDDSSQGDNTETTET